MGAPVRYLTGITTTGTPHLGNYVGAIRRLKHNGMSWVVPPAVPGQPTAANWAQGFDTVADALQGPDGAIYFVRQFGPGFAGPGSLRRLRANPNAAMLSTFSGANQPGNAGRPLEHHARGNLRDGRPETVRGNRSR